MIVHAQKRAKERYGVELSSNELRAMEQTIISRGARYVGGAMGGCSRYAVWCPSLERDITVVWNHKDRRIITVLPEGHVRSVERRRAPRFREREEDAISAGESIEASTEVHEAAPNNILAEALRVALEGHGFITPRAPIFFAQGDPCPRCGAKLLTHARASKEGTKRVALCARCPSEYDLKVGPHSPFPA